MGAKYYIRFILFYSLIFRLDLYAQEYRTLIDEDIRNSARYSWEQKTVLGSKLIDDMESEKKWFHDGLGTLIISDKIYKSKNKSICLRLNTKGEKATLDNRPWGMNSALINIGGDNWSNWNRLSLWVYPKINGHKTVSFYLDIYADSDSLGRGGRRNRDNIILKSGQWNHVISEIEHFDRDNITLIALRCRAHGHENGTDSVMEYYFDDLELQKVEPDVYKGWRISDKSIAYCHSGYRPFANKVALTSVDKSKHFELLDAKTGKTIFSDEVKHVKNHLGEYFLLDFTKFTEEGSYILKIGNRTSNPFPINEKIWNSSFYKALNFLYGQRCGDSIKGVHDLCHVDLKAYGMGDTISINGGWHDAGDLSQGLYNTSELTRVLFSIYSDSLSLDEKTKKQVFDEANWGLEWLLKTCSSNGGRPVWTVNGWWSNNVEGDFDDAYSKLSSGGFERFITVAAEVKAYKALINLDKIRAEETLKLAIKDWNIIYNKELNNKNIDKREFCLSLSSAIIAGISLFEVTQDKTYSDIVINLSEKLVQAQERMYLPGSNGITGFLYTNDKDKNILHSVTPGSYEFIQMIALIELCKSFPDHPCWIKWYSSIVLYSEYYFKRIYNINEPYNLLPGGIYKIDEWKKGFNANSKQIKNIDKEYIKNMILGGTKVADEYVIRSFPPSATNFGTTHLNLAQAAILAEAARLRGDYSLLELSEAQLEWTMGKNPFCRSLMYGEGYNYLPYYNPMSGNIVGALPVGLGAIYSDEPILPTGNNEPSKREVWVHSIARFLALAHTFVSKTQISTYCDLNLYNMKTEKILCLKSSKNPIDIPPGSYRIRNNKMIDIGYISLLPGEKYTIDGKLFFMVSEIKDEENNLIKIKVNCVGKGQHSFELRVSNLTFCSNKNVKVDLGTGTEKSFSWILKKRNEGQPWIGVIIPDGNLMLKQEIHE